MKKYGDLCALNVELCGPLCFSSKLDMYILRAYLCRCISSAAPVTLYYISLRLANFGTQDVKITTSDSNPVQGFTIRARTIALITKNVTHRNPLTFWAKAADHSCVLNNQPSLVVIPEEKTGAWKVVNITDKCKEGYVRYCTCSIVSIEMKITQALR